MALDTASKRISAASVSRKWRPPGLIPDATKPKAWRQAVGRGYYGILSGDTAPVETPDDRSFHVGELDPRIFLSGRTWARLSVAKYTRTKESVATPIGSRTSQGA